MAEVIIGKPKLGAKRGKKHRKYSRQIRKLARQGRTCWGLICAAKERKRKRHEARKARLARRRAARGGFRTKRAMLRFAKFGPARETTS